MNNNEIIVDNDRYIFKCPHCNDTIIVNVNEVNCKIFRHGIYKTSYEQINQHLNKEECDRLYIGEEIYGCGKPFMLDINNMKVNICDYI